MGLGIGSKTVVQCHGCFDIVHPGHIRYLEFARSQGDLLIVSITGDAEISKGELRPYIPQELRAENLAALEFVDYVVIDPNPTAGELLATLRPDVYVKGHEYATSRDPGFLAERQVVESYGGRVVFSSGQVVFSSSRLLEMLEPEDELAARRLAVVCRRHDIDRRGLSGLLGGLRGRRILVLGDTVIERYVLCDGTGVASESPMMAVNELDRRDYLGGAAIVAAQLAGLGARPVLVTDFARDAESRWTTEKLSAMGVEVRALPRQAGLPIRTRFLVDDHKLMRVDRTAVCPLDSLRERQASDLLVTLSSSLDAAIVYDCGCGLVTPGLLGQLRTELRPRLPLLAGSAGPQGSLAELGGFDLLCCSERRLRAALNDFGGSLSTLAYQMLQKTQARRMLVTLGKRGLVVFDRRSHDPQAGGWTARLCSDYLPSFADRVVDRLGCGEGVLAATAGVLVCGGTFMQAAYLAGAAAAMQIAVMGTSAVSADELHRWLAGRAELSPRTEPARSMPVRRSPPATRAALAGKRCSPAPMLVGASAESP